MISYSCLHFVLDQSPENSTNFFLLKISTKKQDFLENMNETQRLFIKAKKQAKDGGMITMGLMMINWEKRNVFENYLKEKLYFQV